MATLTATRSAEQATVSCLICDTSNPMDMTLCTQCGAPMALSHETADKQRELCITTVIGDSNEMAGVVVQPVSLWAGWSRRHCGLGPLKAPWSAKS